MFCFDWFFLGGEEGVGSVCTRWVGLYVIVEKMKIYSYLHVVKNLYPQVDS